MWGCVWGVRWRIAPGPLLVVWVLFSPEPMAVRTASLSGGPCSGCGVSRDELLSQGYFNPQRVPFLAGVCVVCLAKAAVQTCS